MKRAHGDDRAALRGLARAGAPMALVPTNYGVDEQARDCAESARQMTIAAWS